MEEIYKLPLTGEQIAARLTLLDGDENAVEIKANKVTTQAATTSADSDLTLATKGYVDSKATSAGGATSLTDLGITATAEQINRTKFIDGGAGVLILKASAIQDGNNKTLATVDHTHDVGELDTAGATEGQFLRVVNGQATWTTIPSAEDSTF